MIYLPAIHIFCLLGYGFLAAFLLIKNSSAQLNRIGAAILACFMLWCLGKSIAHHPAAPLEIAEFFRIIVIVGAWTYSAFLLMFALILTERARWLRRWITIIGLFAIPVISIFLQWHDERLLRYVQRPFGWGLAWKPSAWTVLLLAHIFTTTILAAILPVVYSFKVENRAKRQQARIVGLSIIAGISLGFVTNILAPYFNLQLPDLAQNFALIWTGALVYAIVKYDFLLINPAMAADSILAAMSDTLILTDDNGAIVAVNPSGADLVDCPAGQLAGSDIRRLFVTTDTSGTQPLTDAGDLSAGNRDFLMKTAARGRIPVSLSVSKLRNKNGHPTGMAVIARDISPMIQARVQLQHAHDNLERRVQERTQALQQSNRKLLAEIEERIRVEQALVESESKFKLISEQSLLGIVILQDDIIRYANRAWAELTGYSADEMMAWKPGEFVSRVHPDDRRHLVVQARKKQADDPERQVRYDWRLLTKNGTVRWISMFSKTIRFNGRPADLASLVDITENKQYVQALEQSEEKYRVLVENANDAILIIQDETILFPNRKTIELCGYSETELKAISFATLVHPEDRTMVQQRYISRLYGDQPVSNQAFRIVNKSGREYWVQANGTTITWENQPAVLSIVRDITVQKKIESQLAHKQRLEAIGTLSGGISHDFNNLLSPLVGYSEYLVDKLPDDSPYRESAEQIFIASRRARDLVRQILTFSLKEEVPAEPVDLPAVLHEAVKLSKSTIPDNVELILEVQPDCGRVNADATQLHQVIINLIINACHAMDGMPGRLNLTLKKVMPPEYPRRDLGLRRQDYLCLTVEDTGCGMDEDTMGSIFDPYYTTKAAGQGTGLGLSVALGIVKHYGGEIDVSSTPGLGSRFDVYLPRAPAVPGEPYAGQADTMSLDGVRVLLVDDDETVLTVTRHMLQRLGCWVATATGGREAMHTFNAHDGRFDMLLTDMSMPAETGEDLALRVKACNPQIRVILSTGYSDRLFSNRIDPTAADAHLIKPVELAQLKAVMAKVLNSGR